MRAGQVSTKGTLVLVAFHLPETQCSTAYVVCRSETFTLEMRRHRIGLARNRQPLTRKNSVSARRVVGIGMRRSGDFDSSLCSFHQLRIEFDTPNKRLLGHIRSNPSCFSKRQLHNRLHHHHRHNDAYRWTPVSSLLIHHLHSPHL